MNQVEYSEQDAVNSQFIREAIKFNSRLKSNVQASKSQCHDVNKFNLFDSDVDEQCVKSHHQAECCNPLSDGYLPPTMKELHIKFKSLIELYSTQQMRQQELQKQVKCNKIFLSMVIHDMRNPTNCIQMGLAQINQRIKDIQKEYEDSLEYIEKIQEFHQSAVIGANLLNQPVQNPITLPQLIEETDELLRNQASDFLDRQISIDNQLTELKLILNMNQTEYQDYMMNNNLVIEEVNDEMFDDNFDEGVTANDYGSICSNESNMFSEKKNKIRSQLLRILEANNLRNDKALDLFVENLMRDVPKSSSNVCNCHTQTDDVYLLGMGEKQKSKMGILLDQVEKKVKNLEVVTKENHSHLSENLKLMNNRFLINQKESNLMIKQSKNILNYYKGSFNQINQKTQEAEKIFNSQIFSQIMMEHLINEMLDIAKIENNCFTIQNDYFDLASTIQEAFEIIAFKFTEKNIELQANIDRFQNIEILSRILGDKKRYIQILLNFLSNAMKFTNVGGTVAVNISIKDEQIIENKSLELLQMIEDCQVPCVEKYVTLQITIQDNGVGISQEGLKNLFINFNKLSENADMNHTGTGLGLSICKQIIEKMGGFVTVESSQQQGENGTSFIIRINTKSIIKVQEAINEPHGNDYRFIQKDGSNIGIEAKFQTSHNLSVFPMLQESNSEPILIDRQQAISRQSIAKKQHYNSHMMKLDEIIEEQKAINVMKSNIDLSQDKSSPSPKISKQINSMLSVLPQEEESKEQVYPEYRRLEEEEKLQVFSVHCSPPSKMKCLIANDEQFQLDMLAHIFIQQDFEVITTINGHEAFSIISTTARVEMFDLVVLDLDMPIADGYQTCSNISNLFTGNLFDIDSECIPFYKPIIIACTSYVSEDIRIRTHKTGFDFTFENPLKSSQIDDIIKPVLEQRKTNIKNLSFQAFSEMISELEENFSRANSHVKNNCLNSESYFMMESEKPQSSLDERRKQFQF